MRECFFSSSFSPSYWSLVGSFLVGPYRSVPAAVGRDFPQRCPFCDRFAWTARDAANRRGLSGVSILHPWLRLAVYVEAMIPGNSQPQPDTYCSTFGDVYILACSWMEVSWLDEVLNGEATEDSRAIGGQSAGGCLSRRKSEELHATSNYRDVCPWMSAPLIHHSAGHSSCYPPSEPKSSVQNRNQVALRWMKILAWNKDIDGKRY